MSKAIALSTPFVLIAAGVFPAFAQESAQQLDLRYGDMDQAYQIRMSQAVHTGPQAIKRTEREYKLDLAVSKEASQDALQVTIASGDVTINVHGMEQNIKSYEIENLSFPMALSQNATKFDLASSGENPNLGLGAAFIEGVPIGSLLMDLMPKLPGESVNKGYTWSTEKDVRLLVGWAWARGTIRSQHEVTSIENLHGNEIVTIRTSAVAELENGKGHRPFEAPGSLIRNGVWKMNATTGRILSGTIKEETRGGNNMNQQPVAIRQFTTYTIQGDN